MRARLKKPHYGGEQWGGAIRASWGVLGHHWPIPGPQSPLGGMLLNSPSGSLRPPPPFNPVGSPVGKVSLGQGVDLEAREQGEHEGEGGEMDMRSGVDHRP